MVSKHKIIILLVALLWPHLLAAELPETKLSYQIEVEVDPASRQLKGKVILRWQSPADSPTHTVPIHLYLNAFAHERTTWMASARTKRKANDRFLKQYPNPWGYIASMTVKQRVAGALLEAKWQAVQPDDGNILDRSLANVVLPKPLAAGETLILEIDYKARLPVPIARTGCTLDFCLVAQWYPKLGKYERGSTTTPKGRWAARQFHGTTEFYAEFADYQVTIRIPKFWQVASTGLRRGQAKNIGKSMAEHRFVQRAVHDFTFALGRNMDIFKAVHALPSQPVALQLMLPKGLAHQLPRLKNALTGSMDYLARHVGPYPYRSMTAIFPNWRARRTGGMEYPTLVTGEAADAMKDHFLFRDLRLAEFTLVHEYIHQYFYGLLASDEQQEAYLDEGFNTYWTVRIIRELYGEKTSLGRFAGRSLDGGAFAGFRVEQVAKRIMEPIISRPASLFYSGTSGNQIYMRPALMWLTAEGLFGRDAIDGIFREYYRQFVFKHPKTNDFLQVVRQKGGTKILAFFREALTQPFVPDYRVAKLTSRRWKAPLGRLDVKGKPTTIDERIQTALATETIDTAFLVGPGVRAVVREGASFVRGDEVNGQQPGRIFSKMLKRVGPAPEAPKEKARFFESLVRVVGPAWQNLPIAIRFIFEDETVVEDVWNGRSSWRSYRFIRQAKLRQVLMDPEGKIAVDARPQNNSRERSEDGGFALDWGHWLGVLGQTVLEVATLWF